jgi:protein-S-isoprenylcysteine O-methyltransferase Ste14|tara:strand:+ start:31 stop:486 length:456 start_codon:yes stop_codon:yes gene_type:complete
MKLNLKTKIPPPLITLICILIIYFFEKEFIFFEDWNIYISGFFLLWGLIIIAFAVFKFAKTKTTVDPTKPSKTSSLVISGIYRITRNPMYLGMLFLIISFTFYKLSLAGAIVIPFFIFYINKYQIEPEEYEMRKKFGENFEDYCKKVDRWI